MPEANPFHMLAPALCEIIRSPVALLELAVK
jgi:hypothetical protein